MTVDLEKITSRIKEKRASFQEYRFDALENDALKTFFDLAQEYETLDNFYRLSVGVIKEFFGLDSCLYLVSRTSPRPRGASVSTTRHIFKMAPGWGPSKGI
jgi:hypothetical protein